MALTDEQTVVRGTQAGWYLEDATFMSFVSEMQTDLLTCIGNTEPHDHPSRDRLYYQHRGLVDLLAHLTVYRMAAEAILSRDEPQDVDLEDTTESESD